MFASEVSGRASSLAAGKGARAFFSPVPLRASRAGAGSRRTDQEGRIEGYASLFGVMDLGRDVVLPGAFRDSIARRGAAGIKLLWQHDPAAPIGVWREISEDRRGLYVRGTLDLAQPKAKQLHNLIEKGALDGLSIGYRTQIDRRDTETGLRRLEKIDLWEVSLVTFPLLPQARIGELKGDASGSTGTRLAARAFTRRAAAAM